MERHNLCKNIQLVFIVILLFATNVGANNIIIKSSNLLMEIDTSCNNGVALSSLKIGSKLESFFVCKNNFLFEIKLRNLKDGTSHTVCSNENWNSIKIIEKKDSYKFIFKGCKSLPDSKNFLVSFRILLPNKELSTWYESSAIRIRWDDCILPVGFLLESATLFPVSLKKLSMETKVFYPYSSGIVCTPNKEKININVRYPSGFGASMSWFAVWNESQSGLYVAAHDKTGTIKDVCFNSDSLGNVSFYFTYPSVETNTNHFGFSPCEIVITGFDGDWFNAAMLYKEWVRKESFWYPRSLLGKEGRKDTPTWMKELCVWAVGDDRNVEQFQEALGVPIGFHWYCWHTIPFDNDYPHYFPPVINFSTRVKYLQEKGIYVMPYINGRLWDTHDNGTKDSLFTEIALPNVTKGINGDLILESYGSQEIDGTDVKLGVMCPSTLCWKNKLEDIILKLSDSVKGYGTKAVYIDQVAAAPPVECFDKNHTHPLGGGDWWISSYHNIFKDIRKHKSSECVLTTESNADGYLSDFDGFLVWQFQHNNQVPAFAAVYGGIIQLFGRNYVGDSSLLATKMKLSQSFVFGEQLGWIDASVLYDEERFSFLKKLVMLRYKFREYFYKGELCRAPFLEGYNPLIKVKWKFTNKLYDISNPAVLTGAWRIPDKNKVILMFVNYSDESIRLNVRYALKDWAINSHSYKICRYNSDGSIILQKALPKDIIFSPNEVFIMEIQDKLVS